MDSPPAQLYNDDSVYLGVWTNWSRGRIRGATLTLSRRNGGLLTAFLALFVTLVGTRLWRIGCFFVHRYFASEHARDALCHQRQAILRNAVDNTSGLWYLLRACWAWRQSGFAPYRRLLPSILFAALTFMALAVATIFSSEITTSMGQEVLLRGSNCGTLMYDAEESDFDGITQPYLSQRTALSMAYAQRCYNDNANSRDCSLFYKPRLPWTVRRNATCPFPGGEDICLSSSSNLRLDSGYIDSNRDLGINGPPGARFLYRSVVDCAPLNIERYAKNTTYVPLGEDLAEQSIDRKVIQYFYGPTVGFDFTYQYPGNELKGPLYRCEIEGSAPADYTLQTMGSYSDVDGTFLEGRSDFMPIPALQANATDVTLLFLSTNSVVFTQPSDDPWYTVTPWPGPNNPSAPLYVGREVVSVLGCASRYQFCNPDSKMGRLCTPLTGIFTATPAADALWRTQKQRKFFNTSSNSILIGAGGLREIVRLTGISSLLARHSLAFGYQGPLPSNQWQLEVENWFGATLADLQRVTVEYVTGPTDPAMLRFLNRPQSDEEHSLCHSLKIRSDAATSFSVLGLGILLGLGGLIITISLTIESLVGWIDEWLGKSNYKRLEWAMNDTLQLQRLAHEELGCGTWIGGEEFPITALGEKLAVLDVSDPDHPKLVKPEPRRMMLIIRSKTSILS